MGGRRLVLLAFLGATLSQGCAHQQPPPTKGIVALHQGSETAVMHVGLPDIVVSNGRLTLIDGILSGTMERGPLNVDIHDDRAEGFAWCGPVQLVISREGDVLKVAGQWNGAPVQLEVGSEAVVGSLVRRGSRIDQRERSCVYNIGVAARGKASGLAACAGMSQAARLVIDARARAALSPAQLAVLVLVLLAEGGLS